MSKCRFCPTVWCMVWYSPRKRRCRSRTNNISSTLAIVLPNLLTLTAASQTKYVNYGRSYASTTTSRQSLSEIKSLMVRSWSREKTIWFLKNAWKSIPREVLVMIVVLLRFDFAGKCSQRVGVRYVTVGSQLSTTAYSLLTEVFSDNVMVPNRKPAEKSHACSVTNMNSSNIL